MLYQQGKCNLRFKVIKLKSILSFKNILRLILTIFVGVLCYAYLLEHNWRYVFLNDEQGKDI